MRRGVSFILISLISLLAACTPVSSVGLRGSASAALSPSTHPEPNTGPVFGHILVLVMENKELAVAEKAPYLGTLLKQYPLIRDYTAVSHPSLPNYLALTGGDTFGLEGKDCPPGPECHIAGTGKNIADLIEQAGLTWKAYLESMPMPCQASSTDWYAPRHNPFLYYDSIRENPERCRSHDVAITQLQSDLDNGSLPNFSWITPNLCNDMHTRCDQKESTLVEGDEWLSNWVPKILASRQFQTDGLLVITFDEGKGSSGCCGAPDGGKVLTLMIPGAALAGAGASTSDVAYNHYSLLRLIEDNWALPYLGHSGDPQTMPMIDLFTSRPAQPAGDVP